MQSASSRIWTRIAVSISYDDNHYTTVTSLKVFEWMENEEQIKSTRKVMFLKEQR